MNETNKDSVQTPDWSDEEMKMPENTDTQTPTTTEKSSIVNGPLLLGLTVLLIIILSGMYYWFNILNATPETAPVTERPTAEANNEPESTTAEAQIETMQAVSTSDEINAIEADVEATDLDSLDAELEAIDAEMEASLNTQ